MAITRRLTLLTYNIHSGVGVDKRYDLARVSRVLNDERPHVAALQELECHSGRMLGFERTINAGGDSAVQEAKNE